MAKESDKVRASRRRKYKFRARRRAQQAYPDWAEAWKCGEHIKVCSCWMCGNPRRFEKSDQRFTLAERRAGFKQSDDY